MRLFAFPLLLLLVPMAWSPVVRAQTTMEEAREDGKAMAQAARANDSLVPSTQIQAQIVPGFTGNAQPQSSYFDDPDQMVADGAAQSSNNEAYGIAVDAQGTRARFSVSEIKTATARATAIESDPATYLQGEEFGGTSGVCTPLPPDTVQTSYYEASCNTGAMVEESAARCSAPLKVSVEGGTSAFSYECDDRYHAPSKNQNRLCTRFSGYLASGQCKVANANISTIAICLQAGPNGSCYEPDVMSGQRLECTSPVFADIPYVVTNTPQSVTESVDDGQCTTVTTGKSCELLSEACVDATPETRIINGAPITRSCWGWERHYQCHAISQANDCGVLAGNAQCSLLRRECIDDPDEPGYDESACKVLENVYRCPVPGVQGTGNSQYICGDDVYCINGDCEPIVREASTDFKDALVALHAIGQAGNEFDENSLTVFSGERDTCHKPVFGLINCCAGKVSGLLTVGAGLGALAGGPTAIAALATPFLALFTCSQDEMKLDIKDRMGFCHKIGTYCSSSVLGICKTKRTAYCCFESKLSRILQEQGRIQLGKPWGKPKKEQCVGFSIEEFASLDLSKMDFSEVYSEFMEAAKLPDEVQTMQEIQAKISGYYDLHGRSQ